MSQQVIIREYVIGEYGSDAGKADVTSVPAAASINNSGLISYKNSDNTTLFTLQLPIYNGTVENGV